MLKVKKSSWHYRLWKVGRTHTSEPKNLCQYFWHLALIKIVFPLVIAGLVLFGIGALLVVIWVHPLEAAAYVFGIVVGAALLFGIAVGGKSLETRRIKKKMSLEPPKQQNLVWVMVKARKKQMCPLIEVVDGVKENMATKPPRKNDPTVTTAVLEYAQGVFDMRFLEGSARAILSMSDGRTTHTFQWFHDELTYREKDFVGKTMEQIRDMHRKKDEKYLRSR